MGVSPAGCGSDCSGAPLLAPLYVACNLGFNIAALNLLRAAGVRAPIMVVHGVGDSVRSVPLLCVACLSWNSRALVGRSDRL